MKSLNNYLSEKLVINKNYKAHTIENILDDTNAGRFIYVTDGFGFMLYDKGKFDEMLTYLIDNSKNANWNEFIDALQNKKPAIRLGKNKNNIEVQFNNSGNLNDISTLDIIITHQPNFLEFRLIKTYDIYSGTSGDTFYILDTEIFVELVTYIVNNDKSGGPTPSEKSIFDYIDILK